MAVVSPTLRIDAVNRCLATIGERPVPTLSGTLTADTDLAVKTVDEIDCEVQSRGWEFNTERIKLLQGTTVAGKVDVPTNAVRIVVDPGDYPALLITTRMDGAVMRLYDRAKNTFLLNQDVYATVVTLYDFEQTPEAYRRYVTILAARTFCDRALSDQAKHVFTAQDESRALKNLKRAEDRVQIKTIFDTYDAARPILRNRIIIGGDSGINQGFI